MPDQYPFVLLFGVIQLRFIFVNLAEAGELEDYYKDEAELDNTEE